jgi:hypothetical protein
MRRKLKPRPRVYPESDLFFLDAESLRKIMSYSRHYFHRWILSNGEAYGIPRCVVLGPTTDLENLRWRADEFYSLRPDLDPYRDPNTGRTTSWMERFKRTQRADREADLASKSTAKQVAA